MATVHGTLGSVEVEDYQPMLFGAIRLELVGGILAMHNDDKTVLWSAFMVDGTRLDWVQSADLTNMVQDMLSDTNVGRRPIPVQHCEPNGSFLYQTNV